MRRRALAAGVGSVLLGALSVVRAHEAGHELPPGPAHDRHQLMEGIGKDAKTIGDALKSGTFDAIAAAAEKIAAGASKILPLFPPGSTHPKSRAKPEIWQNWPKFEEEAKQLQSNAAALAAAATNGGDVRGGAKAMFDTCKSCHDQFRVPEKKR